MKIKYNLRDIVGAGLVGAAAIASSLYANTNTNDNSNIEEEILKQANKIVDQTNANWYVIGNNYIEYRLDKDKKPPITIYQKDKDKDISISGKDFSLNIDRKTNIVIRTSKQGNLKQITNKDLKSLKPYLDIQKKTLDYYGKGSSNAKKRINPFPANRPRKKDKN